MNRISNGFAVFLILIMAISSLSILMVKPAFAQSIPVPVIPEFTIEPVGPSFDIPPTYSFNSSSGFFYVNEGYHFEYSTVEVIIKNQAFTNQTNIDSLLYNVRLKPHNYPDSYWQELFNLTWTASQSKPAQISQSYRLQRKEQQNFNIRLQLAPPLMSR